MSLFAARYTCASINALMLGLVLIGSTVAQASESGPASHSTPGTSGIVRPHLESSLPPPATIGIPSAASGHVLQSASLVIPENARMLVFAPHPDDETLAGAGLIQRILARGGQVRVVFVTNGDGYVDGVRREFNRHTTSNQDFIEYGRRRHDEAIEALTSLGLKATDGIFLGFPDDGIDDLWEDHWSDRHRYTSPHTRLDRPAHQEGARKDVDYAGADLEREIMRTLTDFDPTWVVLPDPRDRHPDHCTTGVFVLDALRRLYNQRGSDFQLPQVYTYLVHSPDYPASPSWVREIAGAGVGGSSTSGPTLAAARWFNLPLSPSEVTRKQVALGNYRSQFHVMTSFLNQFLRDFELFGRLDLHQIEVVPSEYALRFGRNN